LHMANCAALLGRAADHFSENSPASVAEYDVRAGNMRGDAAHVLSGCSQFTQCFNFNQGTILKHAAHTKLLVLREMVRHRGGGCIT
jgi:hypothetical protein